MFAHLALSLMIWYGSVWRSSRVAYSLQVTRLAGDSPAFKEYIITCCKLRLGWDLFVVAILYGFSASWSSYLPSPVVWTLAKCKKVRSWKVSLFFWHLSPLNELFWQIRAVVSSQLSEQGQHSSSDGPVCCLHLSAWTGTVPVFS